jgi:hypothetical protein
MIPIIQTDQHGTGFSRYTILHKKTQVEWRPGRVFAQKNPGRMAAGPASLHKKLRPDSHRVASLRQKISG